LKGYEEKTEKDRTSQAYRGFGPHKAGPSPLSERKEKAGGRGAPVKGISNGAKKRGNRSEYCETSHLNQSRELSLIFSQIEKTFKGRRLTG